MNTAVLLFWRTSRRIRRASRARSSRRARRTAHRTAGSPDRPRRRARSTRAGHTAGQCMRIVVLVAVSPSRLSQAGAASSAAAASRSRICKPSPHCRAPSARHQPVVLEYDADLAAEKIELVEGIVTDDPGFAGTRLDQSGDDVEHGGLAAAGLAEHGHDLAPGDLERQFIHGDEIAAAVRAAKALADVMEADNGL